MVSATILPAGNPIQLVEWLDSARPAPDWRHLSDAPDLSVIRCASVGWIAGESDDVLMLVPNLGEVGSDSEQGCGFIRIPKISIVRRASLSEAA